MSFPLIMAGQGCCQKKALHLLARKSGHQSGKMDIQRRKDIFPQKGFQNLWLHTTLSRVFSLVLMAGKAYQVIRQGLNQFLLREDLGRPQILFLSVHRPPGGKCKKYRQNAVGNHNSAIGFSNIDARPNHKGWIAGYKNCPPSPRPSSPDCSPPPGVPGNSISSPP